MELVLSSVDLDPLPKRKSLNDEFSPGGILNSNYKQVAKCNFISGTKDTVSGKRQYVRRRQNLYIPKVGVILKLSVFIVALAVIF